MGVFYFGNMVLNIFCLLLLLFYLFSLFSRFIRSIKLHLSTNKKTCVINYLTLTTWANFHNKGPEILHSTEDHIEASSIFP